MELELRSSSSTTINNTVKSEMWHGDGNPIEDDKIYTLATLDYLLKGKDGYTMLGVLRGLEETDPSVCVLDNDGNAMTGTPEEIENRVGQECVLLVDALAEYVRQGHELVAQTDGRITIENFIFVE